MVTILESKIRILKNRLIGSGTFTSSGECSIVFNGRYVLYNNSLLYVVYKDRNLQFYIKARTNELGSSAVKKSIVQDGLEYLIRKIESPLLCGYDTKISVPIDDRGDVNIFTDTNLKIVFIETVLYKSLRKICEDSTNIGKNHQISIRGKSPDGNNTYSASFKSEVPNLIAAFKNEAYQNYLEIALSTKFINKIKKTYTGEFYNLFRTFIPILVECRYLYNPLLQGAAKDTFMDSKLYKMTVKKGRVLEILPNGVLTVYLLTHAEICDALEMERFMRFTPQFLYKLIVGFLKPNDLAYPNAAATVRIYNNSKELPSGLLSLYSENDYQTELRKLALKVKECREEGKTANKEEKLFETLVENYTTSNTLLLHIHKDFNKLTHYGCSVLDDVKITEQLLYSYLVKGRLN